MINVTIKRSDIMAKVVRFETSKVVDSETGEVKQETQTYAWNPGNEPNYVKVYIDNIMVLAEINGWISKVMYELIKSVSYANKGQYIIVNAGYKRIIAENLGIKAQTVTNAINELAKKNILIRKERGVFQLNPQFFGKGDWKDIAKIRYEVEIGEQGKTVKLIETESRTTKEDDNIANQQ